MIGTTTNSGLHEFVCERVLSKYARPGVRGADLGTGPGAMAARLQSSESPIGFLRNVGRLLATGGVGVLTTPNVDSLPARCKFLLRGEVRTDERSEPTHISPVFFDLLQRQFLPRAGLRLREHLLFPPNGYQLSRKPIAWALRLASIAFAGDSLLGDNHILVLEVAS